MRLSLATFLILQLLVCVSWGNPTSRGEMVKRSLDVDFMGMRVSYPQYLRLVAIQKEVIKMDQVIRSLLKTHDPEVLAADPYWHELLDLYNSLKKMLPQDYLENQSPMGSNALPIYNADQA